MVDRDDFDVCFNEEKLEFVHIFIPITWSLTSTIKSAHEFMCQKCLKVITRTEVGKANE